MSDTQLQQTPQVVMSNAIRRWMMKLENYPGWKEWRSNRIGLTLYFDDPISPPAKTHAHEFKFADEIERQHAVVFQYLGLLQTVNTLKECEFYFRRYPFRGLPVTRDSHLTNICEMYFSRFYEFRERLKNYLNAVNSIVEGRKVDVKAWLKLFQNNFERELRACNDIHHQRRFEDVAIDRIFLTGTLSGGTSNDIWTREQVGAYQRVAKEWALRVRKRGTRMDEFLEALAKVTLDNCSFLSKNERDPSVAQK